MKKDKDPSAADTPPHGQFLVYATEDGRLKIDVRLQGETAWLTQAHMAALFQTTIPNVNMHLRNIFAEGELQANSVIQEFLITAADGKNYTTKFYNLDANPAHLPTVLPAPVAGESVGEKRGEKRGEKWGEKWSVAMTAKRVRIAEAMARNPYISIPLLAEEEGMGSTGIEKHLKVMRECGCLRRVGPDKGGHWEVIGKAANNAIRQ